MGHIHLFAEHPRPRSCPVQFSTTQWTPLALHEEALRRHKKGYALLPELLFHNAGRGTGHPAGHLEAGVKTSDRQAAKLFGRDSVEKGLHGRGCSPSLRRAPHHEQVHIFKLDGMCWIDADEPYPSEFAQRVGDGLGDTLRVAVL